MSRNTGNKPTATRKSSTLLTGILVGMVIGVGMAAGLAWYIMKSPSPFIQKEHVIIKPPVDVARPVASAPNLPSTAAVSGVAESKPRFEFYKMLTDKQDAVVKPVDAPLKPHTEDSKPAATKESYFLQAGSFSNADDADKLKARLAMIGVEAYIQTVTIPDKGVWHRVRMGPYLNTGEMNQMLSLLKQNGVEATAVLVQ